MVDNLKRMILRFDAQRAFFYSLNTAQQLLDIGCGMGKNAIEIKDLHPDIEIHGVDLLSEKEWSDPRQPDSQLGCFV